jgi:hypothetical protein
MAPVAVKLLHGALFLAILASPLVFIEPSPYEAAAGILAFICVLAGVTFDRKILPLALLLIVFNVAGAWAYLPLVDNAEAMKYVLISFYLATTAVLFACLFADDSVRRLEIMRRAYLIAAFITALIGIAGYFGLLDWARLYDRARATFKDPNVYGPYLILPLLFLIQSVIARGPRLRYFFFLGVIGLGLLLSFSRGAWIHFVISAAVMLVLTFLTAPDVRTRMRIVMLSMASVVAFAGLVTLALSFDSVSEMFKTRAKLTQSYDVGSGGRFGLQEVAVGELLNTPTGLGPHEFTRRYGGQQHNVYLQAFLVYGWAGGFAYCSLMILTLAVGFRLSFVPTPWQPYMVSAVATFAGEVFEGFVIDTDHWRHFFLLLGIIWGLAAATINLQRASRSVFNRDERWAG